MRSKRAFMNVITSFLLQIVVIIYGFIVPRIIISSFGSEVNGLVSSITQFLGFIVLLESGFGPLIKSLLYQPIASNDNKKIGSIIFASEKIFKKISFVFLIYIFLLCIFYPNLINSKFDSFFTISLILIISIGTFAEYYFGMAYSLYLQSAQKSYVINIIQFITYFLNIVLIVILAKINASIQVIKIFTALVFALRPLFQKLYVRKKFKTYFDEIDKKYKIPNKWDALGQHIAGVIHANTDIAVLTIFSSLSEVSVYSIYYMIVIAIKKIIMIFSTAVSSGFGDMIAKKEVDNLNKKFDVFEVGYFSLLTVVCSCTMVLITPFVKVYTLGVTDANYVRYLFGFLFVISEYISMIRMPHINLIYAAGHFKETSMGAWIECIVNIVLSIILVRRFGIIGVVIGTIVAMSIRAIEFIYYCNTKILKRPLKKTYFKVLVLFIETIIIVYIYEIIPHFLYTNYLYWILNAMCIFIISTIIVLLINFILYHKQLNEFLRILKRIKEKKYNY